MNKVLVLILHILVISLYVKLNKMYAKKEREDYLVTVKLTHTLTGQKMVDVSSLL